MSGSPEMRNGETWQARGLVLEISPHGEQRITQQPTEWVRLDIRNSLDILGPEGHTSITWDPDNEAEVAEARQEFDRLKAAGYLLFEVTEERTDTFRPGAGRIDAKIVAAPALVPAAKPDPYGASGATCTRTRGTEYVCIGKPNHRGRHMWRKRSERPRMPATAQQSAELNPKAKRTVAVRPMRGG
jgi:hypothetical protein